MHRYSLLICLFLFLVLSPHSQVNKSREDYKQLYAHAETLMKLDAATDLTDSIALAGYLQVITILVKESNYNAVLSDSYLKCGILKMSANDQNAALGFFRQAISVSRPNHRLPDSLLFRPYLYTGSIQYDLNNLDSAVFYYKKAEGIVQQYVFLSESERLYNKFGALYYETGDYKKSIGYFEKALSIAASAKPVNVFFIVNYKNNIATAMLKMGEYKRALQLFGEILPFHIAEDQLFYNTGNAYTEEKEYGLALRYLRQVKQMDLEKYNSMAKVFIRENHFDSARFYLLNATKAFTEKNNHHKKIDYGVTLKYQGDLSSATATVSKNIAGYRLAIGYYQQAIIFLDPVFSDSSINSNPSAFTGLRSFSYLFDALVAKAAAFNKMFSLSKDLKYAVQALNAYTSALALAKHAERTYFSDDARLFLKNKINPATRDAVETAIEIYNHTRNSYYIQTAFDFAETNKASVLQTGLRDIELLSIPGLPAGLVAEEKKYKSILGRLTVQSNYTTDSATASLLQKKIQENEMDLTAVQEKLDENTFYHQLRFNNNHSGIKDLQQNLQKDEIILSYYYTDQHLVCFYIEQDTAGFTSTVPDSSFFRNIGLLRTAMEAPAGYARQFMNQTGAALFKKLIAPVQARMKTKKRLVIIPYNEICYVPFEMLQEEAGGTMLLDTYSISYQYAAGFLQQKNNGAATAYNVLAMAPFSLSGNGSGLPVLPSSGEEIAGLPGKQLYGADATRQQFIALSNQYPVIHLATHAMANDSNMLGSYIEFYGLKNSPDTAHRLYEPEIYALDLKAARLVILSACETGNGLLVNAEGVMSLSRAFSYAGCNSVITSLWKADDIATAFIIKRLHYYLQTGLAKDEALQKAKLDYIKSPVIEDRYKNPAYWAHLVLIGQYQPLVNAGYGWKLALWITVALVPVLVLLLMLKKKNRV